MMTHEEIEAAIERLERHSTEDHSADAVICRLMDSKGWLVPDFRYVLISLLRQADPDTHMEVPVDVDGVPIHIGDEMERGSKHGRVVALMLSNYPKKWNGGRLHWGVLLEGEQAHTALDNYFHHYHKPTVEDVLREFVSEWVEADSEGDIFAEYAAKIREVME